MKRRILSFLYAFRGLADCTRLGTNFRIQLVAAVLITLVGFSLNFSSNEWCAVVLCIGLVLAFEAMNTALEVLADEVSEERRPRIRQAKDMAAGAVLIASFSSVIVGVLIILPRFV